MAAKKSFQRCKIIGVIEILKGTTYKRQNKTKAALDNALRNVLIQNIKRKGIRLSSNKLSLSFCTTWM